MSSLITASLLLVFVSDNSGKVAFTFLWSVFWQPPVFALKDFLQRLHTASRFIAFGFRAACFWRNCCAKVWTLRYLYKEIDSYSLRWSLVSQFWFLGLFHVLARVNVILPNGEMKGVDTGWSWSCIVQLMEFLWLVISVLLASTFDCNLTAHRWVRGRMGVSRL